MFTFMSTLDGSIVNIALPTISDDMGIPMNQAEWVVSVYLMIVCSCLLLFGKIGDSCGKNQSISDWYADLCLGLAVVWVQSFARYLIVRTGGTSHWC